MPRVLVVDRARAGTNAGGRALADVPALVAALGARAGVAAVARDLAAMPLGAQFAAFENASVVVGVHGAGVPWATLQMPLGAPHCCGVVELYPPGAYSTIRGHGNLARALGFEFARVAIPQNRLGAAGVADVVRAVRAIAARLRARPTCVRAEAVGARAPRAAGQAPAGDLDDVRRYWHARDWLPGDPQRHVAPPPLR